MKKLYCLPILPFWIESMKGLGILLLVTAALWVVALLQKKELRKKLIIVVPLLVFAITFIIAAPLVEGYWTQQLRKDQNGMILKGIPMSDGGCGSSFKIW